MANSGILQQLAYYKPISKIDTARSINLEDMLLLVTGTTSSNGQPIGTTKRASINELLGKIITTLVDNDLLPTPYELAVRHGFSGTEEEWLESLKAGMDDMSIATGPYNIVKGRFNVDGDIFHPEDGETVIDGVFNVFYDTNTRIAKVLSNDGTYKEWPGIWSLIDVMSEIVGSPSIVTRYNREMGAVSLDKVYTDISNSEINGYVTSVLGELVRVTNNENNKGILYYSISDSHGMFYKKYSGVIDYVKDMTTFAVSSSASLGYCVENYTVNAKTVNIPNFIPADGVEFTVHFDYPVASGSTLNVNNIGALPIGYTNYRSSSNVISAIPEFYITENTYARMMKKSGYYVITSIDKPVREIKASGSHYGRLSLGQIMNYVNSWLSVVSKDYEFINTLRFIGIDDLTGFSLRGIDTADYGNNTNLQTGGYSASLSFEFKTSNDPCMYLTIMKYNNGTVQSDKEYYRFNNDVVTEDGVSYQVWKPWHPNTTYNTFTGATDSTDGTSGLVPAPTSGDQNKFLNGSGNWVTIDAGSISGISNSATSITSRNFSITGGATAAPQAYDGTSDVALNVSSLDATKLTGVLSDNVTFNSDTTKAYPVAEKAKNIFTAPAGTGADPVYFVGTATADLNTSEGSYKQAKTIASDASNPNIHYVPSTKTLRVKNIIADRINVTSDSSSNGTNTVFKNRNIAFGTTSDPPSTDYNGSGSIYLYYDA